MKEINYSCKECGKENTISLKGNSYKPENCIDCVFSKIVYLTDEFRLYCTVDGRLESICDGEADNPFLKRDLWEKESDLHECLPQNKNDSYRCSPRNKNHEVFCHEDCPFFPELSEKRD